MTDETELRSHLLSMLISLFIHWFLEHLRGGVISEPAEAGGESELLSLSNI